MPKYKLRRNFAQLADGKLGDYGLKVGNSMTGNPNFTTPPITGPALVALTNTMNAAVGKSLNGTSTDTQDKLAKRLNLISSLDTMATYVELQSGNDPVKLVSSGFELASLSRTRKAPGSSFISGVTNVASGKLGLALATAANAWVYLVEQSVVGTTNVKLTAFTDPRNAVLADLTPGAVYLIRVRVMGSGNQVSEWSEYVQQMAT